MSECKIEMVPSRSFYTYRGNIRRCLLFIMQQQQQHRCMRRADTSHIYLLNNFQVYNKNGV